MMIPHPRLLLTSPAAAGQDAPLSPFGRRVPVQLHRAQRPLLEAAQRHGYLLIHQRDHRVFTLYERFCQTTRRPVITGFLKQRTFSMQIDALHADWEPSGLFCRDVEALWMRLAPRGTRYAINGDFLHCSTLPLAWADVLGATIWQWYRRDVCMQGGWNA